MSREGIARGAVGAAVCLVLLLSRRTGAADEKYALWADFIYTLYSGQKVVWVVTPAFRTDEQDVNGRFTTRISTALTYDLAPGGNLRGQFFLIGRQAEVGEAAFDQRAQILLRYTLFRFHEHRQLNDRGRCLILLPGAELAPRPGRPLPWGHPLPLRGRPPGAL